MNRFGKRCDRSPARRSAIWHSPGTAAAPPEDLQDPTTSRGWRVRAAEQLIAGHGRVVTEFFDVGQGRRSLPWQRRPEAARLLEAMARPDRGFDAVVIGEPQRAFYGNQFGNTFPSSSTTGSPCGCPRSAVPSIRTPMRTTW